MSNFIRFASRALPIVAVLVTSSAFAQSWEQGPEAEPPPPVTEPAPAEPAPSNQPEPVPPPPPPAIHVETPPPAPALPRRGLHVHDGFYLRFGLGGGYVASDVSYDQSAIVDRTIHGGGLALDFMVGGSPARGLAVGGGLWLQSSARPGTDADSGTAERYKDLNLSLLGVFVDGFPDPEGGFHVGGALGLAALTARFRDENFKPDPDRLGVSKGDTAGIGASVWVGYDAWIAPEWSLGGMLRLTGAATGSTDQDLEQRVGSRAISLLFTALYH